jgi:DNA replication and repair protein RecF
LLAQISCRSFRNLDISPWQPGPGFHLVLGANGAGKTSLLEAIYLLATTRSFRTAQLVDCAHHDGREFHLEAEIEGSQRIGLEFGLSSAGRYRTLNGGVTSLIEHLQALPVVAWTDEDKQVLSGPPARRRRFVDQGIVGTRPLALESLARFRRTLFQKRRLLANGDSRGLRSWNELMASAAAELMSLRRDYVERLSLALREVLAATGLELPDIRLEYRPSIQVEGDDPAAILIELEHAESQEKRERRPLVGPQRDEVRIGWGKHGVRQVGSAGERKVLGLLLTAARGTVLQSAERFPVYLLDDADSELDKGRLSSVLPAFMSADQVIVSSSRPDVWSAVQKAVRWHLDAGSISRV